MGTDQVFSCGQVLTDSLTVSELLDMARV